jgi:hypothetical protein
MRIGVYDFLYRVGAPWDGPARPELVELVEAGVLTPEQLPPGRAITWVAARAAMRSSWRSTGSRPWESICRGSR